MKLSVTFISAAIAFSTFAAASPSGLHKRGLRHQHRHAHADHHIEKRDRTAIVTVTRTTKVWDDGTPWSEETPVAKAADVKSPEATPTKAPVKEAKPEEKKKEEPKPSSPDAPAPAKTEAPKPKPPVSSNPVAKGIDADFPDGKLGCDEFPSDYGAIKIGEVDGLTGGWTSLQKTAGIGGAAPSCSEGILCSYACPPGYSKAQWPSFQPASGESHGGILCKDGKLHLTHESNKKLCQKGHGGVKVVNKTGKKIAICRTDYPGSEDMNVPLDAGNGEPVELTVPEASNSYQWRGMKTSAQYYVQPAGLSVEEGCQWHKEGSGKGNWTPMIFGAGHSESMTWISIAQNQLNGGKLNYNVRIVPVGNAQLNGNCKYEDGAFTGAGNAKDGCTAALKSGEAVFELY